MKIQPKTQQKNIKIRVFAAQVVNYAIFSAIFNGHVIGFIVVFTQEPNCWMPYVN